MTFNIKPHTACDYYKIGHKDMYEKGTTKIYSNFTPRSSTHASKLPEVFNNKIVFFGLQGFIKSFLIDTWNKNFFQQPKEKVVEEYCSRVSNGLCIANPDTSHIEALHDLGYLPLSIKALPEGSLVNIKVPVLTVSNTIDEFFWLPNYIESVMSAELWKASTTATTAHQYRKLLDSYADKTGSSKEFVLWQGHDFSFRGLSGVHDAAASGSAHLLSFLGTDTIPAMDYVEDYYRGKETFVGGSVPASEHSVMCLSGADNEIETFRRLIQDTFPTGVVSVVSDSWDYWQVITDYASQLKDVIMSRQPNVLGLSKVVFRPDSGNPVDIICGTALVENLDRFETLEQAKSVAKDWLIDEVRENTPHGEQGCDDNTGFYSFDGVIYKATVEISWDRYDKQYYYIDNYFTKLVSFEEVTLTPEQKGSVECLWEIFGGTTTDKGYKMLDSHVGLIYGDSITLERANEIMKRLEAKGFASGNIVFGIGSFTYQYQTRDSFGFAMKATYGVVNGEPRNIFKDPKTDNGIKKSAKGLLRVEKEGDNFVLYDEQTPEQEQQGELKEVFCDGQLLVSQSLEEIRKRLYG
jgi:nicotinamide phosphoribosyltransferase